MAVTVILLAGGYATRLYPLTRGTPKALLPLGQGVILDAVAASVKTVPEARQCVLVTNRRFADQFRAWAAERHADVRVIDDGTETVEARLGAIRDLELARVQGRAEGDLVVIGTDNLFTWPLEEFVAKAKHHAPAPSVALWELPAQADASQFGVVRRDAESRIVEFAEKSPHPPSREVSTCLYYFPEAMGGLIRRFIDAGGDTDAPGHFITWLVGRGDVYGIPMHGVWYDIGTLEAYEAVKGTWPMATT